ncbi:MAG: hypothetical protein ACTSU2_14970 [Promethearchaeota archaeon]
MDHNHFKLGSLIILSVMLIAIMIISAIDNGNIKFSSDFYASKDYIKVDGKDNNNSGSDASDLSDGLGSSMIDENENYTSYGSNLVSHEFATGANNSQSIEGLNSGGHGYAYINTPPKWEGIDLETQVIELSDNRTWEQNGGVDGQSPWLYDEVDFENLNQNGSNSSENCWGYYAGPSVRPSGTTTGALFTHVGYLGPGDWLNTSEYSAFNQTIYIKRSSISYCAIDFDYYNSGNDHGIATGFVEINGYKMTWDAFSSTGWQHQTLVMPTSELEYYFSVPGNVTIKIGIDVTLTAVWSGTSLLAQELYFDNISLWLRGEALPSQLDLKINGTNVLDTDYGRGHLSLSGNWQNPSDTQDMPIIEDFTTNSTDVNLKSDLTLKIFRTYSSQDNNGDSYSNFTIENNSNSVWTVYYYGAKPNQLGGYNFTLFFPSDWTAISAIDPNYQEVLPYLTQQSGSIIIPTERANNFPGLWKFKFSSPNYCVNMKVLKNTTNTPGSSDWAESNEYFAGDYINITANIKTDGNFTDLTSTNAVLNIKFPNGTIVQKYTQVKPVLNNVNGEVRFDSIKIPDAGDDYVAGTYKIFVYWNNSHSGFLANETGVISREIIIKHHAKITPERIYYADIIRNTDFNIKIQLNDTNNSAPVSNANVYFTNLSGQLQTMTEIAPGYYFAETKALQGHEGLNKFIIHAEHTYFESESVNITVEVVFKTVLSAQEYPNTEVEWNQNITIHLNYTEYDSHVGIVHANFTDDWPCQSHITELGGGLYNIELNTSCAEVNSIKTLNISTSDVGYLPNNILIDILIKPRASNYTLYLNTQDKTDVRSIDAFLHTQINISLDYFDNYNSSTITDASVVLKGVPSGDKTLALINGLFQYNLDADELGLGSFLLTIKANETKYQTKNIDLTITIKKRPTNYELYLNEANKTTEKIIDVDLDTIINISVNYFDALNGSFIGHASVNLSSGELGNKNMNLLNNLYQYELDTSLIGTGVHTFTINCESNDTQVLTFNFIVKVDKKPSNYSLFLNATDYTTNLAIDITLGDLLNISVFYNDNNLTSPTPIIPANVILKGVGTNDINMALSGELYEYILNSSLLGGGVHILNINADSQNFSRQSIYLTITVNPINSSINIYFDNNNITLSKTAGVKIRSEFNISVQYLDQNTGMPIPYSSVNITGTGLSTIIMVYNWQTQRYEATINSSVMGIGIHFLNIKVCNINYTRIDEIISIEVRQIPTKIKTATNSSVITQVTGSQFTFGVYLVDQDTGEPILGANVSYSSSFGNGFLTDEDNDGYYTTTLNNLPVGSYVIYIMAEKGADYNYIEEKVTLNIVSRPNTGTTSKLIVYLLIGTIIAITGFIIAYESYLKYPKNIRALRAIRKNIRKGKFLEADLKEQSELAQELIRQKIIGTYPAFKKILPIQTKDAPSKDLSDKKRKDVPEQLQPDKAAQEKPDTKQPGNGQNIDKNTTTNSALSKENDHKGGDI